MVQDSKRESNGINLGNSIYTTSFYEAKADSLGRFFQMFLILAGVYGTVYSLTNGLKLPVIYEKLTLTIGLSVFYYFIVFYFRKFLFYTLPLTFFFIFGTVFYYREFIINGFYHLENTIIDRIYQYFYIDLKYYKAELNEEECLTILFIIVIQLITISFSIAIYCEALRLINIFIIIVSVGGPLFFGIVPPFFPFFLCVLYLLLFLGMDLVPIDTIQYKHGKGLKSSITKELKYKQKIQFHSAMYTAILFLVLSAIFLITISDKNYKPIYRIQKEHALKIEKTFQELSMAKTWENLKWKLKDLFFSDKELLFNIENTTASFGGLSGGRLGVSSEVQFSNETALRVTLPKETGSVYLKGYVGANYSRDGWSELTQEEQARYKELLGFYGQNLFYGQNQIDALFSILTERAVKLEMPQRGIDYMNNFSFPIPFSKMTVDYVGADKNYLYLPYIESNLENGQAKMEQDSYYLPTEQKSSYTLEYYPLTAPQLLFGLNRLQSISNKVKLEDMNSLIPHFYDLKKYKKYLRFETAYRKFVHDVYTKVPKGIERIQELADWFSFQDSIRSEDMENKPEKTNHILQQIDRVREYLEEQTTYSLTPGTTPSGVDYAEYFLFDNREGYCAHYATSAVLLLRCLNIPARYVEGYVITNSDIKNGIDSSTQVGVTYYIDSIKSESYFSSLEQPMTTVEIKDTNAHAWIEVYIDELGWIPFEVTAGYSKDGEVETLNQEIYDRTKQDKIPSKEPVNTPKPENTPIPTKVPEVTVTPTKTVNAKEEDLFLPAQGEEVIKINPVVLWMIHVLIVIVLICGLLFFLIWIRYRFLTEKRKKGMLKGESRKKVLYIYHEMERILNLLHIKQKAGEEYFTYANRAIKFKEVPKQFPRYIELALRAKFSEEEITQEECQNMIKGYELLRKKLFEQIVEEETDFYKNVSFNKEIEFNQEKNFSESINSNEKINYNKTNFYKGRRKKAIKMNHKKQWFLKYILVI